MDARISTRFGSLDIGPRGWHLSSQTSTNAGLPGLPLARPHWNVANDGLLKVHGWYVGMDTHWQGVFVPDSQHHSLPPERLENIKGVGDCKLISIQGNIVGHPDQNFPARIDFAMPEGQCMMLWRAEVTNTGPREVELETITMLNGRAGLGGTLTKMALGRNAARVDMNKAVEQVIWAWTSLVLVLPFALRIMSLVLRLAVLSATFAGAAFLCRLLQTPLSIEHDPVWASVLVNGWQSFSYAGYLPLDTCFGISGAIRRVLSFARLWSMQPTQQTGAAFSGAFHDGGKTPPRAWVGREGAFPSWLSPLAWREAAHIQSDMFTVLSGGFKVRCLLALLVQQYKY